MFKIEECSINLLELYPKIYIFKLFNFLILMKLMVDIFFHRKIQNNFFSSNNKGINYIFKIQLLILNK